MRNEMSNKRLVKYKSITVEENILPYVEKAIDILDACNIKYSDRIDSVMINRRLRTSWGLCRKINRYGEKWFAIELNQYLFVVAYQMKFL